MERRAFAVDIRGSNTTELSYSMSFRIGSREFFIEPAPQFSFFQFDHIRHSTRDRELWFMGRHIVVSKLA